LAIRSFLDGTGEGDIVVWDNSPEPLASELWTHARVKYVFACRNMGFGAGHNLAVDALPGCSDVHLFLNPDVVFDASVLPHLMARFDEGTGAMMPNVVYESGEIQYLAKLLPSPLDLIFRRFLPIASLQRRLNERYELQALSRARSAEVPSLSGCFLLVRTRLFKQLGGFDTRYFMYMEDVDLVRRIGDVARTVYEPRVSVVHGYAKGSYSNPMLLRYHMASAIRYFMKWGWFFDKSRRLRNRQVLRSLGARRG
jgi:hypothetical protein